MNISVDKDFARFGSKSYAINKINTVEVRERKPHGQAGMFVCGLLAFLFGMTGLTSIFDTEQASSAVTSVVIAIVLGFIAYRLWLKSKIVEYQLFLMTSSSEAQAITSQDGEMIADLRRKIETAMVVQ